MSANFLHGVETIELKKGPVPIRVVKSAVIGLVGSAPKGPVQALTVVNNAIEAAQFGQQIDGFTIPQALEAIFKQGAGTVLVVNVADTSSNSFTAAVTDEEVEVENRAAKLAFAPFGTIVVTNEAGDETYTANTDYTIDELGNITILAATGDIAEGATLKVSYRKFDPTTINAALLIGTINGGTGVKTGMKLFKDAYNMYGFKPKILITPGYSSLNTVATEMIAVANEHKAIALLDAPLGTTVSGAVAGRGPLGSINFNTSSERAYLLYPHFKVYNPVKDAVENQPYSQFMAGVIASTDNTRGYWVSPSNKEIFGVQGPERVISFAVNDAQTEANQLNEAGITCYASSFGTGFRTWGNRTAAWPTNTNVKNFLVIRRIADIVHESIELAMLQFIDEPLDPVNRVTIDAILDSVNAFIRTLIGRGALIQGSRCEFDPAKNPANVLAAGQVIFDLVFMGPTPAERITFESFVDQSLLTPPQTV